MPVKTEISKIQEEYKIIGREKELRLILIAAKAKKHIILEGAVGSGKTHLARALAHHINADFFRIDGSEDVLSHTLVGYFDPPIVIAKGYVEDAFIYGPLSQAMLNGGCLFINELNRIPESSQNVLLSALDEHIIVIPKLKSLEAKPNFITIATQNPAAHVGVSALGEALKDRFIWIHIDFQSGKEEVEIVLQNIPRPKTADARKIATTSVKITRKTREHPDIRRGVSIRGAIDLAQLISVDGITSERSEWYDCAIMALHSKLELMDGSERNAKEVITEIVDAVLENF